MREIRLRGGTAYVTLEPCNHSGRTGPCTEALIAAGLSRVVAATGDPNPTVTGRGMEALQAAGIETVLGVCEAEARRLNEAFACWIQAGRPFVLMKVAMTLDGRIAPPPGFHTRTRAVLDHQRGCAPRRAATALAGRRRAGGRGHRAGR